MESALTDPAVSRLIVTGHPNHELAIFGFVQRLRPRLLFLTDGGGEERVSESRAALASLGLLDRARFLGWSEESLYRALLERNATVFAQVVAQVRSEIEAWAPRQILCESIELYNPLHDVTLPIVRAAARGLDGIEILEFPLIAQEPGQHERYRVQRLPEARAGATLRLTAAELAAKLRARDHQYGCLRRQLGDVLTALDRDQVGLEVFAPALEELPTPGRHHVLRYEWRARLLRDRGEINQIITYRDHFLPMVAAL
ncbi:MAG TPA: hypothetical protein VGX68_29325 [Thermoanaerobaculia bacterium]|jgi:hypothetical protein|nr:hypothetical protein [Thermoanaerobaculia bacterium]